MKAKTLEDVKVEIIEESKKLDQRQASYDVAENCYKAVENAMQWDCMIASYDEQTKDYKFEEPDPTDNYKYEKYLAYKRCLQAIIDAI